jgi:hypothetical protein
VTGAAINPRRRCTRHARGAGARRLPSNEASTLFRGGDGAIPSRAIVAIFLAWGGYGQPTVYYSAAAVPK